MLVSDFGYDLPQELIAQQPPAERGDSRMLLVDRHTGAWDDRHFRDLPALLRSGDLLVLNDTRVLPARLLGRRAGLRTQAGSPPPDGIIEVLLTEQLPGEAQTWRALVKPAKKVQPGEWLSFPVTTEGKPLLRAEVLETGAFGERTLRFTGEADFHFAVEQIGSLPLPPYIRRQRTQFNTAEDRERYQTVYAGSEQQSAAAPTAGLHFTPEILSALEGIGVEIAQITLHVGLGTFQPVRAERTEEIRLHKEPYALSPQAAHSLNRAWAQGRRIIAVGTTTTRTLEHMARRFEAEHGPLRSQNPLALEAHRGETGLFFSPGPDGDDRFRLVGGLLTNFHLPESTLLMLVSAFAGREHILRAYRHAVEARYRFFSYGDCMLLL